MTHEVKMLRRHAEITPPPSPLVNPDPVTVRRVEGGVLLGIDGREPVELTTAQAIRLAGTINAAVALSVVRDPAR